MMQLTVLVGLALSVWGAALCMWHDRVPSVRAVPLLLGSMLALLAWRTVVKSWTAGALAWDGSIALASANDQNGASHDDRPSLPPDFSTIFLTREKIKQVWESLRKLGIPRADRLDAMQEVFVNAFRSFERFDRQKGSPERWLNGIIVHVAQHYRNRACHRRERAYETDESELEFESPQIEGNEAPPNADEEIEFAQERAYLRHNVRGLLAELDDTVARECIVEHDMLGHSSVEEIAHRHGISVSSLYKRRAKALAHIRDIVQEWAGEPEWSVRLFLASSLIWDQVPPRRT